MCSSDLNFDPVKAGVVGDDVLFTFTFPDGKETGPATTYATIVRPSLNSNEQWPYLSRYFTSSRSTACFVLQS